mmetsp:Transcript_64280/g.149538  ORF Transcript_64280/g.149538 Transcript_64280/m.149538 type:complete len:334 (-) Transcript_64280:13-1014(-)
MPSSRVKQSMALSRAGTLGRVRSAGPQVLGHMDPPKQAGARCRRLVVVRRPEAQSLRARAERRRSLQCSEVRGLQCGSRGRCSASTAPALHVKNRAPEGSLLAVEAPRFHVVRSLLMNGSSPPHACSAHRYVALAECDRRAQPPGQTGWCGSSQHTGSAGSRSEIVDVHATPEPELAPHWNLKSLVQRLHRRGSSLLEAAAARERLQHQAWLLQGVARYRALGPLVQAAPAHHSSRWMEVAQHHSNLQQEVAQGSQEAGSPRLGTQAEGSCPAVDSPKASNLAVVRRSSLLAAGRSTLAEGSQAVALRQGVATAVVAPSLCSSCGSAVRWLAE